MAAAQARPRGHFVRAAEALPPGRAGHDRVTAPRSARPPPTAPARRLRLGPSRGRQGGREGGSASAPARLGSALPRGSAGRVGSLLAPGAGSWMGFRPGKGSELALRCRVLRPSRAAARICSVTRLASRCAQRDGGWCVSLVFPLS